MKPKFRTFGLDWATFSRPNVPENELHDVLATISTRLTSTGREAPSMRNYHGVELAGYGSLLTRKNDVLVNLPGQALAVIRDRLRMPDDVLCEWFATYGFTATRIDLAIDTQDAETTVPLAWKHWQRGAVACAAKARIWEPKRKPGESTPTGGWTMYIGSPSSERMLRIYDKAKELLDKKGKQLYTHLTRIELQTRHDYAEAVAKIIAQKGISKIPGILRAFVAFKVIKSRISRVERRPDASWWSRIVSPQNEYLQLDPNIATPEKTLRWLNSTGILRALKLAQEFGKMEEIQTKVEAVEIPAITRRRWNQWVHPAPITSNLFDLQRRKTIGT